MNNNSPVARIYKLDLTVNETSKEPARVDFMIDDLLGIANELKLDGIHFIVQLVDDFDDDSIKREIKEFGTNGVLLTARVANDDEDGIRNLIGNGFVDINKYCNFDNSVPFIFNNSEATGKIIEYIDNSTKKD